jgi:type I restriction enzyme S subunit
MAGYGYRLDCSPYLGGALETKILLEKLPLRKDKLHTLTAGFNNGIYNGPQFVRNYVESSEHGVPFMTGSTMQLADLSTLPLLSRRDAQSPKLAYLELQRGMSLISCSGTIGKMAYARREMEGVWSSQDLLKVVADPAKIPSGFLYAYLCSKFGIPLVASGTYGAIIQHLEPAHIWDLPVPRLGDAIEYEIHTLIEEAAELRTQASQLRRNAVHKFEDAVKWKSPNREIWLSVNSSGIQRRLDVNFHSHISSYGRNTLDSTKPTQEVRNYIESIYCPDRGARTKVENEDHGVPFLSSSDVFEVAPTADFLVSKKTRDFQSFILDEKDVLLPRSGSLGGVIGRAVLPLPSNYGQAGTDHLIHLRCRSVKDAHYLWAVLASKPGYAAVRGTAFGSAIPSLDMSLIADLDIPLLDEDYRDVIANAVTESVALADRAIQSDRQALELVETNLKVQSE